MKVTVRQIVVGVLGMVSIILEKDWRNWKLEEESRLYRPQHCSNRFEYVKESWKAEQTCCHSESSKRQPVKTGA